MARTVRRFGSKFPTQQANLASSGIEKNALILDSGGLGGIAKERTGVFRYWFTRAQLCRRQLLPLVKSIYVFDTCSETFKTSAIHIF